MTVAEILESLMLVCFGLSWPMSVYKNIKAKSARNMSLPFILLICSGYVAGITAKIINHNITYVLLVYFLNLAIVSINIVVYFINKGHDKKAEDLNASTSFVSEAIASVNRKAVSK